MTDHRGCSNGIETTGGTSLARAVIVSLLGSKIERLIKSSLLEPSRQQAPRTGSGRTLFPTPAPST
jgi:hypothetical protein